MPRLDEVLKRQADRLRDDVRRRASGEKLLRHVPTGFKAIDETFGGIELGVLTTLLAHTGDGKSAFARQVAQAAAEAGAGVRWWCGEDPEQPTAERYLADGTGITATEMGRLELVESELVRISQAAVRAEWARRVEVLFEVPTVDELLRQCSDGATVGDARVRLVVVDYAQIFGDSHSLEGEIAALARGLNGFAGERSAAVLLLSQVRGEVLQRGRERYFSSGRDISGFCPGLGDSEWCRRMEKSSKAVWALYRPGRWRRELGEDAQDDIAELHVRKANFGPTGWEELGWNGEGVRFFNKT